jgi:uncharacterized protein (DUF924 family)
VTGLNREAASEAWIGDVLGFWFEELGRKAWFRKDAAVDQKIRERFLLLYEVLATWPADDALASAERALATVLVLDQFPRNIFRDTPQAFATDALALQAARGAIACGYDAALGPERRVFLYLPFEHSEDEADQARAVELISTLGDEEFTRYALAHKAVIDRFERFPHRNALLGRPSTPEEESFLDEPGSSF